MASNSDQVSFSSPLNSLNRSNSPTQLERGRKTPILSPRTSLTSLDRSVLGYAKRNETLDHTRFGLQSWREYAFLKYGTNQNFQNSPHGKFDKN